MERLRDWVRSSPLGRGRWMTTLGGFVAMQTFSLLLLAEIQGRTTEPDPWLVLAGFAMALAGLVLCGVGLPLMAHAALDYKAPLKLGASPVVKMWTSRIGGKSWDFDYELKDRKTGVVYATAKTVQVAYDYQLEKSDVLGGDLLGFVKGLKP